MDFSAFRDIVKASFPEVTQEQLDLFEKMQPLYEEWNAKINVISRKDIDNLYSHHVIHSLAIAKYLQDRGVNLSEGDVHVLDVGTGGGFPGIPLAVMFPAAHFTLCDSVGKKTIVASAVSEALGLKNVEVVNRRAEELGRKFDYVVSRAVTTLDNFYPWVKGCYSKSILYLKGGDIAEETGVLQSRHKLGKGSISVWPVNDWLGGKVFDEGELEEWYFQKFVVEIK